ncbi:ABC transporter ATP-binding protein [Vineibacter terrae]|uniref:ABC transporter ATP-binding protein n=1 Tax=Vineibacter terrae TaxID=2586908 RepID=A0A5C8PN28_9HYPH|nr:ABC transporter ATP-binding protein [Vineibacter terrae]TXL75946.1 ABC transporter ATP-binding protein [Vineibacter terrae]
MAGAAAQAATAAAHALQIEGIGKQYGTFHAVRDVSLRIDRGRFLTLLGPSGSGKTTLLMMIAGFTRPTTGRLRLDDRDITDLPPEQRNFGMVFQGYALFPHLTVRQNIEFPLQLRRIAARERAELCQRALEMVQLQALGDRHPRQLSGGQQQRVALARALVFGPDLLLLDEPLSALDKKLRADLQGELRQLHQRLGTTFIYVTHDQEEALSMSDEIVIFNRGSIVQRGNPRELYDTPASHFVADFLGRSNFIEGRVERQDSGTLLYRVGDLTLRQVLAAPVVASDAVLIGLRPEKMQLASEAPAQANALPAVVKSTTYLGADQQVLLDSPIGEITVRVPGWPAIVPRAGDKVWAAWAPDASTLLRDDRA